MIKSHIKIKASDVNENKEVEAIVYFSDEKIQFSTSIVLGIFPNELAAIDACKEKLKKDENLIAYTTRPTRTQNSI